MITIISHPLRPFHIHSTHTDVNHSYTFNSALKSLFTSTMNHYVNKVLYYNSFIHIQCSTFFTSTLNLNVNKLPPLALNGRDNLQRCTSLEKVIKWLSIFFFRYKDAQEQRLNRIAGYVKLAEYTKTRAFLFEF